jgi:hypothetical protein
MDLGEARHVEDIEVDPCVVGDSEHWRRWRRPAGDRESARVERGLGFRRTMELARRGQGRLRRKCEMR